MLQSTKNRPQSAIHVYLDIEMTNHKNNDLRIILRMNEIKFRMISHIQIYKSTSTWLIIGESVQRANSFRILKISRNLLPDLITDDRIYSRDEINSTVEMAEKGFQMNQCFFIYLFN